LFSNEVTQRSTKLVAAHKNPIGRFSFADQHNYKYTRLAEETKTKTKFAAYDKRLTMLKNLIHSIKHATKRVNPYKMLASNSYSCKIKLTLLPNYNPVPPLAD
jgi:hypothetical protein